MNHWYCKAGDVLLYDRSTSLTSRVIDAGEVIEDGVDDREFHHVAIALDPYYKIEADGNKTTIVPIDYGMFATFRPPYDRKKLHDALDWARTTQVGRLYGWVGILDQALRIVSRSRLHLPRWFVQWANARWPYCSPLGTAIMIRAGFNGVLPLPPPNPEVVYHGFKDYEVQIR